MMMIYELHRNQTIPGKRSLSDIIFSYLYIYNWPAPPDDPQGIRVASVIEFSVCLCVCLFVCLLVFNIFMSLCFVCVMFL